MARYRSILGLVLAVITVVVLSLSSPALAAKSFTYTPEKLAAIQEYTGQLAELRDRMSELQPLIRQEDWTFVRNFIHGPLGELRIKMSAVTRELLPSVQKQAREISRDLFDELVVIDEAAAQRDAKTAVRSYAKVLKDFDAFLMLVPKA